MNKNINTNMFLELLALITVMTIFSILGIYSMPYLLLLVPAPFIVFNIKNNIHYGNLALVIVGLIISFVVSTDIGTAFLILFLPAIVVMSYLILFKRPNKDILFFGIAIFFVSLLLIIALMTGTETSLAEVIKERTTVLISTQVEMLEDMNVNKSQINKIEKTLEDGMKYLIYIIPSILLVFSTIVISINTKIAQSALEKVNLHKMKPIVFSRFKVPGSLVPGVIVSSIFAYLVSKLGVSNMEVILANILVLISFSIFIQGLSVISFFLIKRRTFIIVRIIVFGLIFIIPTVETIVYIIGLMDLLFNFRKIK